MKQGGFGLILLSISWGMFFSNSILFPNIQHSLTEPCVRGFGGRISGNEALVWAGYCQDSMTAYPDHSYLEGVRSVCCASVTQLCPTLCDPMGVARQALLSMRFFPVTILEWVAISPGIKPWSPALPIDSLPSELPGKPLQRYGENINAYY